MDPMEIIPAEYPGCVGMQNEMKKWFIASQG